MQKYLIMLWLIFAFLLLALLTYLLFLPIDIVLNSTSRQFFVRLGVLARADVVQDENYLIRIDLRTLFMRFKFYPLKRKKSKKKTKKKSREGKFKWSYLNTAVSLIRSFEVKNFSLDIDTGSCITNAKLYPAFAFLDFWVGNYQINFDGRNHLELELQNRPYRIIKSFINPKKLYHGITF